MPISNLCISTNVKYEGGRGVVKEGRTIGEGLELLKDIRVFFLILCNIPILLLWFNPFNIWLILIIIYFS